MKKILIPVLLILSITISAIAFFSPKDKAPDGTYYIQYVQDKLNFPYSIDTVELVNAIDAFADQTLDIKANVSMNATVSLEKLVSIGWNYSKLPDKFESERLLEKGDQFDREILSCNEKFDCLWIYIDEYLAFYGEKAQYGSFASCVYGSPNYVIGLYEPKSGQLFFKESDS